MAATTEKANEKTARYATQEIFGGFDNATQAWRDMFGFQVRTAKTLVEQGMGITKKASDHIVSQLEEGMKLQQDAIKYSLNLMEDWKKVAFDTAEKAIRNETH